MICKLQAASMFALQTLPYLCILLKWKNSIVEWCWSILQLPRLRVQKILHKDSDSAFQARLYEPSMPFSLASIVRDTPFHVEIRYVLNNEKYRIIYDTTECSYEVFPPYDLSTYPTKRDRVTRTISAVLYTDDEDGLCSGSIDVTSRILKYMGPRGNFHQDVVSPFEPRAMFQQWVLEFPVTVLSLTIDGAVYRINLATNRLLTDQSLSDDANYERSQHLLSLGLRVYPEIPNNVDDS